MKRWSIALVVICLVVVPSFFAARHFSERRRQTSNVRHDAQWFTTALKTGNKRAVANYLARPRMDSATLELALRAHAQSLLSTDFNAAPVSFRSDGSALLATFHCSGGAAITFYTEDGGDIWRISELIFQ